MDNETPLQKQKLKEFNEILETPDPQVEKKNPPIPTAGSTENKEKMKDDLENIPDPKSKQKDNKTSKQNFSEGSLKDNISKQYN